MSLVCIYCIIFILLSHGFILGLSALCQSYPAIRFSWPVEYRKWCPLLKKCPCLINASFPFTMLNLCQCPSLINTPCLIDAPMTISPQIYQQITKRSSLKHLVQCQDSMKTQTTKLRFETEIWTSWQHRCINRSSRYSAIYKLPLYFHQKLISFV